MQRDVLYDICEFFLEIPMCNVTLHRHFTVNNQYCKCNLSPHVAYVFENESESYTRCNFKAYINKYIHVEWDREFHNIHQFRSANNDEAHYKFSLGFENKSVGRMAGIDFIHI